MRVDGSFRSYSLQKGNWPSGIFLWFLWCIHADSLFFGWSKLLFCCCLLGGWHHPEIIRQETQNQSSEGDEARTGVFKSNCEVGMDPNVTSHVNNYNYSWNIAILKIWVCPKEGIRNIQWFVMVCDGLWCIYYIILYFIILYHIIWHHIIWYHIILYYIIL